MYLFYSILLSLGFFLMSPLFVLRRAKYANGLRQRLGHYPKFEDNGRKVIWLHCVSVGESNAARPLVERLLESFPDHAIVISTTTKTGQELAANIFKGKAAAIVYFPFDWKFSVRRALANFRPSLVLLMETEIWPRFIHEARLTSSKVVIINGRLSASSFSNYSKLRSFVGRVLAEIDLALMQNEEDAARIKDLGLDPDKVIVTGNMKFDQSVDEVECSVISEMRQRFAIDGKRLLIVAASTHPKEEEWIIESLDGEIKNFRLLIAPRHPERFDDVARLIEKTGYSFARRSSDPSETDVDADIILLDTIGELRDIYSLADIVFVGGSLVPHGGQSILEPAAAGNATVTGPYTHNFDAVVKEFLSRDALIQLPEVQQDFQNSERLYEVFVDLMEHPEKRRELGANAYMVMDANRGAVDRTIEYLTPMLSTAYNRR